MAAGPSAVVDDELERNIAIALDAIAKGESLCFVGMAGTGKSFFTNALIARLKPTLGRDQLIAITATTGAAASHVEGAATFNYAMGVGIGVTAGTSEASIISKCERFKRRFYGKMFLLIVDEFGMLSAPLLALADKAARKIRGVDKFMGGVSCIFIGDPAQLPPVNDMPIFKTPYWCSIPKRYIHFTTPKRYPDMTHFRMLCEISMGRPSAATIQTLKDRVAATKVATREELDACVCLYATNKEADVINQQKLAELGTELIVSHAQDDTDDDNVRKQFDNRIPRSITMAVGAKMIYRLNSNVPLGLYNGANCKVLAILPDGVEVEFNNAERTVLVVPMNTYEVTIGDATYRRMQYPLIPGYAITIHRAQGATLQSMRARLNRKVRENGQAFVAISRVKELSGLYLEEFDTASIIADRAAVHFYTLLHRGMNPDEEDWEMI